MMLETIVNGVHTNRISFLGGLSTVIGVTLLASPVSDIYGAGLVAFGQGIDCIDGSIARNYNQQTLEGARLDPLLDKVKTFAIGTYIIAKEVCSNNILLPLSVASNFALDYISQKARGPIYQQFAEATRAVVHPSTCVRDTEEKSSNRANVYGKVKAALQNVASFGYIAENLYMNHIGQIDTDTKQYFNRLIAGLFATAVVFGGVGVLKRSRLKKTDRLNLDSAR
jgi:phosphatidylglycerophosphate synthase